MHLPSVLSPRTDIAARRSGVPPVTAMVARAVGVLGAGVRVRVGAGTRPTMIALGLPLAIAAALLLVQRPALCVGLLIAAVVIVESGEFGFPPGLDRLYTPLANDIAPVDLLFFLAVAAVVLDALRTGDNRLPLALVLPTALYVLAIVAGAFTGHE